MPSIGLRGLQTAKMALAVATSRLLEKMGSENTFDFGAYVS
jgi:hypothetical protein